MFSGFTPSFIALTLASSTSSPSSIPPRGNCHTFVSTSILEAINTSQVNGYFEDNIIAATFGLLVISGIFLLMYYQPNVATAFDSVNYTIMKEVEFGWLWRHVHGVAASVVFLIIYIHMFTGIYYGSYKKGREVIWLSGMLLPVLFSAEAFSGYMLPWGQMSYWAAAVILTYFLVVHCMLISWSNGLEVDILLEMLHLQDFLCYMYF